MAKAVYQHCTDAQSRKRGEQIGLDTLVVHAVNDDDRLSPRGGGEANALSHPPGKYGRKTET